ncbi:MAG TPA: FlgD immunoglobulin-like domain containing protein [Candidatus Eisenbacteria bacterium]|nr:FlgD immunoglobulin-like domain containing protein [Candidatus Eisenbacteria bacterium]
MRKSLLLASCLLGLAAVPAANAQCVYTGLASGSAVTATGGAGANVFYQFTQVNNFWAAIAVLPAASNDWDISTWGATATYPSCVQNALANSNASSGADLVMGNFNTTATGTYYVDANHFSGSGNGTVEWQGGAALIGVGAPLVNVVTGATNIVQTFDVLLTTGHNYTFTYTHGGTGATRLLLFRPTGGTEWLRRSSAEFDVNATTTYTATTSGYYALVVINDNGQSASDYVGVGECLTPIALADGVPATTYQSEAWYSFDQEDSYWTAVAVRGPSDWDIQANSVGSGGAYPFCISGNLSASTGSPPAADFIVGDFNYNSVGTNYVRSHLYQDIGSVPGQTQWARGHIVLSPNGPGVSDVTGPNSIIHIYDAFLSSGTAYTFLFSPSGAGSQHLLLFRNPSGTSYWTGRSSAEFSVTGNTSYTAPASGYYGLVVVNDDGNAGAYDLRLGTCSTPLAMTAGTGYYTLDADDYWSFDQEVPYWTAVGVQGSPEDYDITANTTATGSTFPACQSGALALGFYGAGTTDFVVGDFNYNAFGTYYAHSDLFIPTLAAGDIVQWDSGSDLVHVNGATVSDNTGTAFNTSIVKMWDVFLQSGTAYTFRFNPHGAANLHLLLFRNTNGAAPYWNDRSAAQFDMVSGQHSYTAPISAFYGVAVVNDNAGYGFYDFRVDAGSVSVDASAPIETGLTSVAPNPGRGGTRIGFALARAADVALDVVDASGRRVASLGGSFGAGRAELPWDGRDSAGAPLPAGLYFVRMRADGRVVGTRRLTLLD